MKKIILIEDTNVLKFRLEKIFAKIALMTLETLGSNVINSHSISYMFKEVSLYIIDLDNHNNNGIALIKMIRNLDVRTPIIAMSKNAEIAMLKRALVGGCNDFILKPFDDNALVYKVKKLLDISQTNESSPNQYLPDQIDSQEASETILLWDKEFKINVDEIDDEHRSSIENYEILYKMMKEGKGHDYYQNLIVFLNDYVHTHFEHEQKIHADNQYPLKEEHIAIHREFKASVVKISNEGIGKEVSDMDLIKISLFIKNWLIHHILIEDHKFGDFLAKQEMKDL